MLDYKEIERDDRFVRYAYLAGEEECFSGIVSLDIESGVSSIIALAPNDESAWYAKRLAGTLERYWKNGTLRESGTIIWF